MYYNRSKIIKVLILIISILVISSCNNIEVDNKAEKINGAKYLTDSHAYEMYKDEKTYSLINLISHEVYILEDAINIDYYFDKDVTKVQIDKALSSAINIFVLRVNSPLSESPYQDLNYGTNRIEWNKTFIRIYVNEKLTAEESYVKLKHIDSFKDDSFFN